MIEYRLTRQVLGEGPWIEANGGSVYASLGDAMSAAGYLAGFPAGWECRVESREVTPWEPHEVGVCYSPWSRRVDP